MTLLSSDSYLPGVLCLALSLRNTGTQYPLLVMVTDELSEHILRTLSAYDLPTHSVRGDYVIPADVLRKNSLPRWIKCIDKVEVFELVDYERVVFLDGDMLVLKNIDELFEYSSPSAVVYHGRVEGYEQWNFPNCGLLSIQPEVGLGRKIFDCWPEVVARHPTFSDQDLIHAYFRKLWKEPSGSWEIPVQYNACVFLLDKIMAKYNYNFDVGSPNKRTVAVLHFSSSNKPRSMSRAFLAQLMLRKLLKGKWNELRAYQHYLHYLKQVRTIR